MIYLGSDHGGFDLKEKIKKWLKVWGYKWEDCGNNMYDQSDDYPEFAIKVAKKVVEDEGRGSKGIVCCRSAAGMVIAANKVKGARAVTACNERSAKHSREHNNANVLALSGDWLEDYQAKDILKTWIETEFSGEERHVRRLMQIDEYEQEN